MTTLREILLDESSVALIFLVLGFIGLLLVMGAASFVRWLKMSSPRSFRAMLSLL